MSMPSDEVPSRNPRLFSVSSPILFFAETQLNHDYRKWYEVQGGVFPRETEPTYAMSGSV